MEDNFPVEVLVPFISKGVISDLPNFINPSSLVDRHCLFLKLKRIVTFRECQFPTKYFQFLL